MTLLDEITAPGPSRNDAKSILAMCMLRVMGSLRNGTAIDYEQDIAQARRILSAACRLDLDEALFEETAEFGEQLTGVRNGGDLELLLGVKNTSENRADWDTYLQGMITARIEMLTAGIPE